MQPSSDLISVNPVERLGAASVRWHCRETPPRSIPSRKGCRTPARRSTRRCCSHPTGARAIPAALALRVDHVAHRHPIERKRGRHLRFRAGGNLAIGIDEARKAMQTEPLYIGGRNRGIAVERNRNDDELRSLRLRLKPVQDRQFTPARRAPTGPEAKQDAFPAEGCERPPCPTQITQPEMAGMLPNSRFVGRRPVAVTDSCRRKLLLLSRQGAAFRACTLCPMRWSDKRTSSS